MKKKYTMIMALALIVVLFSAVGVSAAKKVASKSVTLSPMAVTIAENDVVQLKAKKKPRKSTDKITWTSSNPEVATVTKSGQVMGVSEGNAIITVETDSNKTAECEVTVKHYLTKDEVQGGVTESRVIELIKEQLKGIGSGTSSGVSESDVIRLIKQYAGVVTTAKDIKLTPSKSCIYQYAEIVNGTPEEGGGRTGVRTTVNIDSVHVDDITEFSYDEFLARDKGNQPLDRTEVYWKYTTNVSYAGSVDPQFAGQYIRVEFSGNNDDREWWSEDYAKVKDDGFFSGVCGVRTNYIPSEIILVYADVWDTRSGIY